MLDETLDVLPVDVSKASGHPSFAQKVGELIDGFAACLRGLRAEVLRPRVAAERSSVGPDVGLG